MKCPNCNSNQTKKKSVIKRSRETRIYYQCKDCQKNFSQRLDIKYPAIRNLLRSIELSTYRKVEIEIEFMLKERGVVA